MPYCSAPSATRPALARGVQLLREDRDGESEFVTICYRDSVDAVAAFAGADPTRVHHPDRDAEFLVELPDGVQILEIVSAAGTGAPTG
jgi:hypothetical protein